MKLYSGPLCIFGHACRIVLQEKTIDYEALYVQPGELEVELAELNPYGETPTLLDRDLVLFNPVLINEYLDERLPHPPLMPIDPVGRSRARLLIYRLRRDWLDPLQICIDERKKLDRKSVVLIRDGLSAMASVFENQRFVLGDEFSLADCYLGPLLWRLPMFNLKLPKQARGLEEYGNRIFARTSFAASLSEAEKEIRGV
ncbi:MAG: glutathione S-transferase N-terminal domain-containing protein [Pseudomonadota bacterium]|nr:glutathione S-transferase N-terminal domain-containing protein [Pseudomonadota bacterium]